MSTFKGVVKEFPDIRIDYFRNLVGRKPPLACFLSHVHSDHLQGLESLKAPFIYCSSATRELLLCLEKYPDHVGFANGVLEVPKQRYKHLKDLLKPVPLNSPVEIELDPKKSIRVTLLNANHCPGAVMFLIQSTTAAILYTGDIRSESWWVNSLVQNPVVIPFISGHRKLDTLYLDTTFATNTRFHRTFPTKADGLKELLSKVSKYPKATVFYFHSWTLGYEEVWIALAAALGCQVHVDQYKMRIYNSLAKTFDSCMPTQEGFALCGFRCGNWYQSGCLTSEANVRIHSCEHGITCSGLAGANVVWITPNAVHLEDGLQTSESGAGGGIQKLVQSHKIKLEVTNTISKNRSVPLEAPDFDSGSEGLLPVKLNEPMSTKSLPLSRESRGVENSQDHRTVDVQTQQHLSVREPGRPLTHKIYFPYSRHSSYEELCHLVRVLKPSDIYPCSIDEKNWIQEWSMKSLFGHLCPIDASFSHDNEMLSDKLYCLSRTANLKSSTVSSVAFLENSIQPSARFGKPFKSAISVGKFNVLISDSQMACSSIGHSDCSAKHDCQLPARIEVSIHKNQASNRTFPSDGLPHERTLNNIRKTFNEWLGHCDDSAIPLHFTPNIELLPCNKLNTLANSTAQYGSCHKITCLKEAEISEGKFCCVCTGCHAHLDEQVHLCQHISDCHDQKFEGLMLEHEVLETALRHSLPQHPKYPKIDYVNYPNTCSTRQNRAQLLGKRINNHISENKSILNSQAFRGVPTLANFETPRESDSETQFSVSDSVFESQESLYPSVNTWGLQNRKQAYKAARKLDETGWEETLELIASGGGHGNEETML